MFDDPRITRQLADARLEGARRYVADRRLAGRTRHRHHDRSRLRMTWTTAFHRADRSAPAPHPTTA
ncbi:MAG: hypothetical protein JWM72_961 [Actinomycetia bacterium]|jgi:hypothetical protein|nr:hypothetical protein [Actinomycetes bacterium]MDQ1459579.1 hypothetical protein [Actinomycetota bacterium]